MSWGRCPGAVQMSGHELCHYLPPFPRYYHYYSVLDLEKSLSIDTTFNTCAFIFKLFMLYKAYRLFYVVLRCKLPIRVQCYSDRPSFFRVC